MKSIVAQHEFNDIYGTHGEYNHEYHAREIECSGCFRPILESEFVWVMEGEYPTHANPDCLCAMLQERNPA